MSRRWRGVLHSHNGLKPAILRQENPFFSCIMSFHRVMMIYLSSGMKNTAEKTARRLDFYSCVTQRFQRLSAGSSSERPRPRNQSDERGEASA